MSEIKVNKLTPRTNCGTVQLGDSGDTITIPSGATITNNGTAAGFGATGAASWDTTVKTASFTGVAGVGYFVNTTSGAITVTLPASPDAGAVIAVSDYANTFDTNNVTLARNGSNIEGDASDFVINQEGVAITFVYVDATKGWITTDSGNSSDAFQNLFITATGGTITTCGNFKIHTFTGPGTFCVSAAGNPSGSNTVDYMVVAGGGGSGRNGGGGGGGGFRESSGAASGCYTTSPLGSCVSALPVTASPYPITVGGGGPGGSPGAAYGVQGSNSIFSTITSAGGGGGGAYGASSPSKNGGSGGGGGSGADPVRPAGTGNTPPVSPPQGNNGGLAGTNTPPAFSGGGGGGATQVGTAGPSGGGGPGGNGATTSISASPTSYSGGAGGGAWDSNPGGNGGTGGGGNGGTGATGGTAGTANTGGGGGGPSSSNTSCSSPSYGAAGGSGIVIIRYKFQ